MNKQELIGKIKSAETLYLSLTPFIGKKLILDLVKQLDEPQKVQVPQFVADLIEYAKKSDWDLEDTFQDIAGNDGSSDIYQWYYSDSNNMDTFARAWLDGYEVEKEKRYLVKMKNIYNHSSMLKLDSITGRWFFGSEKYMCGSLEKHTRKELEEAGFSEVFNSPLFEVEEVQDDSKI